MVNAARFENLPLRARKRAQVRLALLEAVLSQLATAPLSAVNVKACCAHVGVSEPTFFNYFGSKTGALIFFVQLWSIEAQWYLDRATTTRVGLQALFDRTADGIRDVPWLIPEIVVGQIRRGAQQKMPAPITEGDCLLRFPELPGVQALQPVGIESIFSAALTRAVTDGELPTHLDLSMANQLLVSLFFGSATCQWSAHRVAETLRRGLAVLWRSFADPPD